MYMIDYQIQSGHSDMMNNANSLLIGYFAERLASTEIHHLTNMVIDGRCLILCVTIFTHRLLSYWICVAMTITLHHLLHLIFCLLLLWLLCY